MKKKKNAPELRFKGFVDDWEQRKLGEVFEQTSEYINPMEANLELFSLTVEKGLTQKTDRYNRSFLVKKEDKFKKVNPNDFVYNPMNMTLGAVGFNELGYSVAISGYYITMKTTANWNNQFFRIWLSSPQAIHLYKLYATGSLIEKQRVQFPNLSQIKMWVPSLEEQKKVGNFFKQLDETIALYQERCEKLNKIKRAYLDLIFSQKIRFSSFSEEWELRNLDSLVERIKSYSLSRDVETSEYTGYKYIHYGDIHTKVADIIDESSNLPNIKAGNYELLEKGDVVLADASEDYQGIATPAVITIDTPYKLVAGLHTIALRPRQVDSFFLYYLINSSIFRRYGYKTGTGMKVFGISVKNLLKFESLIPPLEDQIKIGKFFKKLDENIDLHEKKLMKLNELKKAYLQKMFV